MNKDDEKYLILFSTLGSVAFAFWQNSVPAGFFMFFVLIMWVGINASP